MNTANILPCRFRVSQAPTAAPAAADGARDMWKTPRGTGLGDLSRPRDGFGNTRPFTNPLDEDQTSRKQMQGDEPSFPAAWKSGLVLWSAKWWETPEQRMSSTSTLMDKACEASGPHFQLPLAAAASEDSLFPGFLAAVCNQGSRAPRVFIYLLRAAARPVQNVPKSILPAPWHRGHPGLSPPSPAHHTEPRWNLPSGACHQSRAQSSSFLLPDSVASLNTPL